MSEWQEVDAKRKPAGKAPEEKDERGRNKHRQPGDEKGSSREREEEPDGDKEAPP